MNDFTTNVQLAKTLLDELNETSQRQLDAADSMDMAYPDEVEIEHELITQTCQASTKALDAQTAEIARLNALLNTRLDIAKAIDSPDARTVLAQFIWRLTDRVEQTLQMIERGYNTIGPDAAWGAHGRDIIPQCADLRLIADALVEHDTPHFSDLARKLANKRVEGIADAMIEAATDVIHTGLVSGASRALDKFRNGGAE